MSGRRRRIEDGGGNSLLESLPYGVVPEILKALDLESLCSAACVSRTLRSSVSQSSSFHTLDLSFFSPDDVTLNHIHEQLSGYKSLTLDCLRLDNSTINNFLGRHIEELNLLKCTESPDQSVAAIYQTCPDLRALNLEFGTCEFSYQNLGLVLDNFSYLKSLCIKIRPNESEGYMFMTEISLPKTLEVLKLKPIYTTEAIYVIKKLINDQNVVLPSPISSSPVWLKSLSLLVNIIHDELIIFIASSLPHLVELDLEDRPVVAPHRTHDLTDHGLQSLGTLQNLITLALVRSKKYNSLFFTRVNDMGMFLLSECCKRLLSIKLGGFSKVSDAGFSAILHSCRNLEKFVVQNSPRLSDLAFHHIGTSTSRSLVNVKLSLCSLVTSDAVIELSVCSKLEMLNLSGCKSIANKCLTSISSLIFLSVLNLEGADVTDSGMGILGRGFSPITNMSLRGCKRISDKGISLLLSSGGTISTTLTSLDIGYIAGISDDSISTIAAYGLNVTELSVRYCFSITGTSLKELGSEKRFADGKKLIRWLDLYKCIGLTFESLETVKKPFFRGLRWIGLGATLWDSTSMSKVIRIRKERPWLTVCLDGCGMGCNDGWQFHTPGDLKKKKKKRKVKEKGHCVVLIVLETCPSKEV